MIIQRRNFLIGLVSMLAAPAIVRAENIMPVRKLIITDPWVSFQSWPIGSLQPTARLVEGYDLLSRARVICQMTGGSVHIREQWSEWRKNGY